MKGYKYTKMLVEENYHKEIDIAIEQRIRMLDVIENMRVLSNEKRRQLKAKKARQ